MKTDAGTTTQATATATAGTGGATAPGASTGTTTDSPSPQNDVFEDPLDAALDAAFADAGDGPNGNESADAGSGAGSAQTGATSTATGDGGQGTGEGAGTGAGNGNGTGTEAGAAEAGSPAGEELPEVPPGTKYDPENLPPGFEGLPKGAVKRILKQVEQIADLKGQLAEATRITVEPTPLNPLGHALDSKTLTKEINTAQFVQEHLGGLQEADFKDGGDGVLRAEVVIGQRKFVFTQAEVAQKLGFANAVLEPNALLERQKVIATREQTKPWETAEKILPGMLTKGTKENTAFVELLQDVPELAYRLPDFEVYAAEQLLGRQMAEDNRSGKFKWVRMALNEKGEVVPPQQTPPATKSGGAQTPKPPIAPNGARPPVTGTANKQRTQEEVVKAMPNATPDERLDALLDAAFG